MRKPSEPNNLNNLSKHSGDVDLYFGDTDHCALDKYTVLPWTLHKELLGKIRMLDDGYQCDRQNAARVLE